jgi:hypothetical protein
MSVERRSLRQFIVTVGLALILMLLFVVPMVQAQGGIPKQFLEWAVIKKLTVQTGGATFQSDVTLSGSSTDLTVGGDATVTGDLTAGTLTGSGTITAADLVVTGNSTLGNAAGDTTAVTGDMTINGARDGTTGYDYFLNIDGNNDGLAAGAKTYAINVTMSREAGDNTTGGDLDDAGLKIRVTNAMTNPTAGNTLRGFDISAKNDNPDGAITNLEGGLVSIQTDTGAGNVNVGRALEVNTTINAPVTDTLQIANFRLFRQTATEATDEDGVIIRNSSTTGDGADSALYITSDYGGSATTDSWDYGVDMSSAAINTADIRLENGETISNGTDGLVDVSGDIQFGDDNLYGLGYASSGYEIECGTTETFTDSTTIVASNLTTVTVPILTQVTAPAATAAFITATDPTTAAVTINSFESDFDAGSTGVVVHYCLIGED